MADWKCEAKRDWPLGTGDSWDGDAAKAALFTKYGFDGDSPDHAVSKCFLFVDAEKRDEKGSYKCPFCDVVDGEVKAMPGGLSQCRTRIDGTDCGDAKADGQAVLDAYKAKEDEGQKTAGDIVVMCPKCGGEMTEGKCDKCDTMGMVPPKSAAHTGAKQTKAFAIKVRPDSINEDEHTCEVVISDISLDRDSEVVIPEGIDFSTYLKNNPVVLGDHDYDGCVRSRTLDMWVEPNVGLVAKAYFPVTDGDTDEEKAVRGAWYAVTNGLINAASIGFIPTKINAKRKLYKEQQGPTIEACELLEWSWVKVPSNPNARVRSVQDALASGARPSEVKAVDPDGWEILRRAGLLSKVCAQGNATRAKGGIEALTNYLVGEGNRAVAKVEADTGKKLDDEQKRSVKAYAACVALRDVAVEPLITAMREFGLLIGLDYISDEDLEWSIGMDVDGDREIYDFCDDPPQMPGLGALPPGDDGDGKGLSPTRRESNSAGGATKQRTPEPEGHGTQSDNDAQARAMKQSAEELHGDVTGLLARAKKVAEQRAQLRREAIGGDPNA